MLQQFGKWLGGGAASNSDSEQKLRDISLEYTEAELIAATNKFEPARRLGSGNYGAVYRGTLRDGHDVAIKVMEVDEEDDDGASGFADEVRVLSKFRHPNLVTLMGWGTGKGRQFLVYELLGGGDVSKRLQSVRSPDGEAFGWAERLWIALDAASGLSHMHNSTPKAFHRDIKSANILLDSIGTAKMADFGLSGIAKNKGKLNMTCEQISGTPGYACPHYIKSGRVTEGTEVYAFGMVMLELLLNSMPACLGQNGGIIYPIFQVVMPQAAGALDRAIGALDVKAGWPPALAKDMAELALACSDIDEARRPSFTDVSRRLRQLVEQNCGGKRPHQLGTGSTMAPSTQMGQMGSTGFRGPGVGPGTNQATRPQLGVGHAPGPGGELPTRPQMGVAMHGAPWPQHATVVNGPGSGLEAPTNPQLGIAHAPGMPQSPARPQMASGYPAGPGMEQPTRPQLGLGHGGPGMENPTRHQMGGVQAPAPGARPPGGGMAPTTSPQMYSAAAAGQSRAAPGPSPEAFARHFSNCVRELADTGWEAATEGQASSHGPAPSPGASPAELAEAVLECTHASGVDVKAMPLKHRCLVLRAGDGSWTIGRQLQPYLFARLVPDEALLTVISRSHLQFTSDKSGLRVKKLTPNAVLVNGQPLQREFQELVLAQGSQIGFCGKDNATPFVTFTVLLRGAAPASKASANPPSTNLDALQSSDRMPSQLQSAGSPYPAWWNSGPPTPYSLVCVLAWGYDITTQPWQARTVGVPPETRLTLGRIHQPGFFEGVLGTEAAQRYLCCVSRSHLEVVAAAGAPPGCFEVTNLSANPVALVGQRRLGKGDKGLVRPGDTVDFIGGSAGPSGSPVVYLKLRLEGQQGQQAPAPAAQAEAARAPPQQPARDPLPPPAHPPPDGRAPASPRVPATAAAGSLMLPAAEEMATRSPRLGGGQSEAPPPFRLELRGSAVRRDFPRERRHIDGREDGLTVGRAHQQALHAEAFEVELRQYLSREHFRIERTRDGLCKLVPMSSNPIWRVHRGRQTEAVRGDPALPLEHGDFVQLFTGADDCTADGPGNLGTLLWVFQDAGVGEGESPRARHRSRGSKGQASDSFFGGRDGSSTPRGARDRSTSVRRTVSGASASPKRRAGSKDAKVELSYGDVDDKFAASGFRY